MTLFSILAGLAFFANGLMWVYIFAGGFSKKESNDLMPQDYSKFDYSKLGARN